MNSCITLLTTVRNPHHRGVSQYISIIVMFQDWSCLLICGKSVMYLETFVLSIQFQ